MLVDIQIEIEIPNDIVEDKIRLNAVQKGIEKSIIKGLYEEGVAFKINKSKFNILR